MTRAAIALSLLGLWAASAAAADRETISLKPHGDFSIELPKGWKACDDANDKLLGGAVDPLKLKPRICDPHAPSPDFKFGAFEPQPAKTTSVLLYVSDAAPITAEEISGLTPEMLQQVTETSKKEKSEALAKIGSKLEEFSVRIDKLGGQVALVSTVLQTPKQGPLAQACTETWEIPFKGRYYQLSFVWAKSIASSTKPTLDSVKASIKFE